MGCVVQSLYKSDESCALKAQSKYCSSAEKSLLNFEGVRVVYRISAVWCLVLPLGAFVFPEGVVHFVTLDMVEAGADGEHLP